MTFLPNSVLMLFNKKPLKSISSPIAAAQMPYYPLSQVGQAGRPGGFYLISRIALFYRFEPTLIGWVSSLVN